MSSASRCAVAHDGSRRSRGLGELLWNASSTNTMEISLFNVKATRDVSKGDALTIQYEHFVSLLERIPVPYQYSSLF